MVTKKQIAIVGGGLIGMMSAYFLVRNGANVCLFEKSDLGRESTWAGGGILSPLYPWKYEPAINHLAERSKILYPDLAQMIHRLSQQDPEYQVSGLAIDSPEFDDRAVSWCSEFQTQFIKVSGEEAGVPGINSRREFVLLPNIGQVRNPRLAKSLGLALAELGVNMYTEFPIKSIRQVANGVELSGDRGSALFDKVVIATGAWSGELLKSTGLQLPVSPVRGQMLLFRAEPNWLKTIVLANGRYMIPRRDGRVLVGSTMEQVGFDKSITQTAEQDLKAFVLEYLPELLDYTLEKHWSGLRPGSPSGIPIIGQHPHMDRVYINTGHFRNGVILAPASAELLCDVMLNKNAFIDPEKYSVNSALERMTETA